MSRGAVDLDKLRVALRRMSRGNLPMVAERAIEIVPRAKLTALVGDMVRLDEFAEGRRGAAPLLDEVRKFHEASLRVEYHDSFDVNSKNFMDLSEGAEAFIAAFERLVGKCVRAAEKGPRPPVREAFELLFALLRRPPARDTRDARPARGRRRASWTRSALGELVPERRGLHHGPRTTFRRRRQAGELPHMAPALVREPLSSHARRDRSTRLRYCRPAPAEHARHVDGHVVRPRAAQPEVDPRVCAAAAAMAPLVAGRRSGVQAEARRRGLIPDLPGPMGKNGGKTGGGSGERR